MWVGLGGSYCGSGSGVSLWVSLWVGFGGSQYIIYIYILVR